MKLSGKHKKTYISIGSASSKNVEASHNRLFVIMIMFAIGFLVISLRVFDVAVISGEGIVISDMEDDATQNTARRADIVDRNGIVLATSLVTASLYANPKIMLDKDKAIQKLSKEFKDLDVADLRNKINSDKSFVWIKRNLTPQEQFKVNSLGIAGVYFKDEEKRIYPHKNLFSHTLGFVNVDGAGLSGMEKQFNDYLNKKTSDYLGVNNSENPLELSMDVRVQNIVREALLESISTFKAKGASGIVIDVTNGEVISMVSLPDFDLNQPNIAKQDELFNRATFGVYEMGSTFKSFSMAMALDNNVIRMKDSYDVAAPIKIGGFSINDYHPKAGNLTVPEIFMYSSNIGTAKIALDAGVQVQKKFLKKIGLMDELTIEIPEKGTPLLPPSWSKISSMTVSYGHGIAVTPMHMAAATASLVNGGILYPATLLKREKGETYGERVVNIKTSDNMRKLLRFAVQYGTGGKAEVASYMVGGKTGSADKVAVGGYNRGAIISSFIGAFPMNQPKYVVFVMVDEPVGNQSTGGYATGGMVAAPVVHKIISRIGPMLGVMPVDENQYEIKKEFWYDNGTTPSPQLVSAETY